MQHLLSLAADKADDRDKLSLRNLYLLFCFTHGRWAKLQTENEFERNIIISQDDSLPCIYLMNWIL